MATDRTVVIDAFPHRVTRYLDADAVVCIDVMLSTTTLVTAAASGRRAAVAASVEEVRTRTRELETAVVAGDDPTAGCTLLDSPVAVERLPDRGSLVLLSPPGTELIRNAAACRRVLVACFRNLSATAAHLAAEGGRVALLAAGCREEFSCEDQMAAAWMAERLLDQGFRPVDRRTAELVRRWKGIEPALAALGNSAVELRRAGRDEDVEFVLGHFDDLDLPCRCAAAVVAPAGA
jgi:phosphosulfolactate phosphohydrolase-like enzyme